MVGEDTGRTLKTTRTSLRVLELVLEHGGLTLAELDRLVDAPKNSLHAHLTTLRDCRYLVQDGDTYEIAFRLALLGDRVGHRHPADGIATDVVEELGRRTDEEAVAATGLTLGLPFVRGTTLHGTAYDVAGEGVAVPDSLVASVTNAARAIRARR